jgi:hypothetical protein
MSFSVALIIVFQSRPNSVAGLAQVAQDLADVDVEKRMLKLFIDKKMKPVFYAVGLLRHPTIVI